MKVYKIAKGWAIFIYISASLLIALFIWLFTISLTSVDDSGGASMFMILLSLGMIGLCVIGILDTIKGKIVVSENSIRLQNTFRNRELNFDEIKGFKENNKHIWIIPNTPDKKKITISPYTGYFEELHQWLEQNFQDLNAVNEQKEQQEILSNAEFGGSEEERTAKLKQAKLVARVISGTGALTGLWTIFYPNPYELALIASIVVPLVSIVAVIVFKGLIRIDEKPGSAHPSILLGFLFPSIGLALRAILDFNILDFSTIWLPAILLAVGVVVVLFLASKELQFKSKKDFFTAFSILLFFFGYGYGAIVTTNCYFDNSETIEYKAEIIEKRISSGKTTLYYFKLSTWGTQEEPDEVSVSSDFYDRRETGDSVSVYWQAGRFDIPWIFVAEE